jgi:translocation protein SEC66
MADVHRVLRLREDKPALQALLQKGSIGDDLWNSLLAAEKEMEAEIIEVVAEANSFVEGWGQVIFPTANEMIANEKMRNLFETVEETKQTLATNYGMVRGVRPQQLLPVAPPTPQTPSSSNGIANASSDAESATSPSTPSKPKGKKRK